MTRIISTSSFISKDEAAVTLVEIEPEAGDGYIDVTGSSTRDWYLDWQYSGTSRTVDVSVRITTDGVPVTFTDTLELQTATDDKLFSEDSHLVQHEHDIMKYLPAGHSTFNFVHRRSQTRILEWLDENGYTLRKQHGKVTKDQVLVKEELREWSVYKTLELIFAANSNSLDDIFEDKRKHYQDRAGRARHKYLRGIDWNESGEIESFEELSNVISSTRLVKT